MIASRRLRVAQVGALVAVAAACATAPAADDPFSPPRDFEGPVTLTVENNDYRDATIYAYWNGARDRVGTVTGKTKKTFQMRWRSEEVRLEVDFLGGGGLRSEPIAVYGGDHLNYVIPVGREAP